MKALYKTPNMRIRDIVLEGEALLQKIIQEMTKTSLLIYNFIPNVSISLILL